MIKESKWLMQFKRLPFDKVRSTYTQYRIEDVEIE